MAAKVVVANWVEPAVLAYLGRYAEVVANQTREPWSHAELRAHCRDAEALIAFMPEWVDDDFLSYCPRLRIVAGALKGHDNFDLEACTRRGVWLTVVPDLLAGPTAELAVGLMIALGRNIGPGDALVRAGKFAGWRPRLYGRSLDGSTVGLLGAGALGRAVAQRLAGFDCALRYCDTTPLPPAEARRLRLRPATLAELQADSDFLVLALPLTPATRHLVDQTFVAGMRPGSYLINPARGSLVDEAAVADALEAGQLAGYAADTFESEDWARPDRPAGICPRLLRSERTVLTPHLGSAVTAVRRQIAEQAAASVVQCLSGQRPQGAVNAPKPHSGTPPAC